MLSGWDRVNWCRTNEQNKRVSSELVVGVARHCPQKKEHRLTVQTCGRGASVSGVVGSAVADPYSGFICWVSGAVQSPLSTSSHLLLWTTVPGSVSAIVSCHLPWTGLFLLHPVVAQGCAIKFRVCEFQLSGFCPLRACFIECHPNTWEGEEGPGQECLALVRVSSSQGRCVTLGTQEPWGSR